MKFLYILLVCLLFAACKPSKNDPVEPCPAKLDFTITAKLFYQNFSGVEVLEPVEVDTIYSNANAGITLEANDVRASSYEWQIGIEPNKRLGRKVTLAFAVDYQFLPTTIDVSLTVKYAEDDKCHQNIPNKTEKITKKLTIVQFNNDQGQRIVYPRYFGKFRGYDLESPTNIYDVNIYNRDYYAGNPNSGYNADDWGNSTWIDNLSGGLYIVGPVNFRDGVKFKYFSLGRCLYPQILTYNNNNQVTYINTNYTAVLQENRGWGKLDEKNSNKITIYYQLRHPVTGAIMPPRTFVGNRIP